MQLYLLFVYPFNFLFRLETSWSWSSANRCWSGWQTTTRVLVPPWKSSRTSRKKVRSSSEDSVASEVTKKIKSAHSALGFGGCALKSKTVGWLVGLQASCATRSTSSRCRPTSPWMTSTSTSTKSQVHSPATAWTQNFN